MPRGLGRSRLGVSAPEQRALSAYVALMRAAQLVTLRVHRHLDAIDLTLGQFAVLEALVHGGPLRHNVLAERILTSAGNLSIVLSNLQRRALIRREPDPADRRGTIVRATAKAERLIGDVFPAHAARIADAFAVLTAAEQDQLRRLCRRVKRAATSAP
ncbi:MAG: MarR family winged helix-turn-helix transcriptional regulator [Phycisphaerae bacterium]